MLDFLLRAIRHHRPDWDVNGRRDEYLYVFTANGATVTLDEMVVLNAASPADFVIAQLDALVGVEKKPAKKTKK